MRFQITSDDETKGDLSKILYGIPESTQVRYVIVGILRRLYSIFAPHEVGEVQKKISDNDGRWHELVEKETYRFLSFQHAVFLT